MLQLSHTLKGSACRDSFVNIDVTKQELSGYILNAGTESGCIDITLSVLIVVTGGLSSRFGGVKIYFVAQLGLNSPGFNTWGVWDQGKDKLSPGQTSAQGTNIGAWIGFTGTCSIML